MILTRRLRKRMGMIFCLICRNYFGKKVKTVFLKSVISIMIMSVNGLYRLLQTHWGTGADKTG